MTEPTPIRPAWLTDAYWAETDTTTLHELIAYADALPTPRRALFLATIREELRRRAIPPDITSGDP